LSYDDGAAGTSMPCGTDPYNAKTLLSISAEAGPEVDRPDEHRTRCTSPLARKLGTAPLRRLSEWPDRNQPEL